MHIWGCHESFVVVYSDNKSVCLLAVIQAESHQVTRSLFNPKHQETVILSIIITACICINDPDVKEKDDNIRFGLKLNTTPFFTAASEAAVH